MTEVVYPTYLTSVSLFTRIDARDRSVFKRLVIAEHAPRHVRWVHQALTHLGGAWLTIGLCTLPLLLPINTQTSPFHFAARVGLATLLISHFIVRILKRTIGRPRPSARTSARTLITEPDCFSFPSGHSAAAMSVALAYAVAFPLFAAPLLGIALAVGGSRVFLGVHYPGDVVIGQMIALITGAIVLSL